MPLVSILTPCHNSAPYLEQCVRSVLDQEYQNWEHILLDDGSTDNSWEILQQLQKLDPRLKVHRAPQNLGISKARNELIAMAQGSYIAFLDSDDEMYPDRLSLQVNYLQKHSQIDILGSNYLERTKQKFLGRSRVKLEHDDIVRAFSYMCPVPNPTLMAKARVMKDLPFNESFSSAEDLDFLIRAQQKGYRLANLPQVTMNYLVHEKSASSSKKFEMQLNTYLAIKQVARTNQELIKKTFSSSLYIRFSSARFMSSIDQIKCLLVAPLSEIGRFFLKRRIIRALNESFFAKLINY
jgi:glycosyltransferase involved in cell wall biosynthesis